MKSKHPPDRITVSIQDTTPENIHAFCFGGGCFYHYIDKDPLSEYSWYDGYRICDGHSFGPSSEECPGVQAEQIARVIREKV